MVLGGVPLAERTEGLSIVRKVESALVRMSSALCRHQLGMIMMTGDGDDGDTSDNDDWNREVTHASSSQRSDAGCAGLSPSSRVERQGPSRNSVIDCIVHRFSN